ncbi:MAG: hypothetical protein ACM3NQ_20260 [Bacteroidales bacterium]
MATGTSETRLGLADRYRIVAMVGRDGMSEVYRADDLRLGQPVALKFLPHALEQLPLRCHWAPPGISRNLLPVRNPTLQIETLERCEAFSSGWEVRTPSRLQAPVCSS